MADLSTGSDDKMSGSFKDVGKSPSRTMSSKKSSNPFIKIFSRSNKQIDKQNAPDYDENDPSNVVAADDYDEKIEKAVPTVVEKVEEDVPEVIEKVVLLANIENLVNETTNANSVGQLKVTTPETKPAFFQKLMGKAEKTMDRLQGKAEMTMDKLQGKAEMTMDKLQEKSENTIDKLQGKVEKTMDKLQGKAMEGLQKIIEGKDAYEALVPWGKASDEQPPYDKNSLVLSADIDDKAKVPLSSLAQGPEDEAAVAKVLLSSLAQGPEDEAAVAKVPLSSLAQEPEDEAAGVVVAATQATPEDEASHGENLEKDLAKQEENCMTNLAQWLEKMCGQWTNNKKED